MRCTKDCQKQNIFPFCVSTTLREIYFNIRFHFRSSPQRFWHLIRFSLRVRDDWKLSTSCWPDDEEQIFTVPMANTRHSHVPDQVYNHVFEWSIHLSSRLDLHCTTRNRSNIFRSRFKCMITRRQSFWWRRSIRRPMPLSRSFRKKWHRVLLRGNCTAIQLWRFCVAPTTHQYVVDGPPWRCVPEDIESGVILCRKLVCIGLCPCICCWCIFAPLKFLLYYTSYRLH